jgi:hypothetical protein
VDFTAKSIRRMTDDDIAHKVADLFIEWFGRDFDFETQRIWDRLMAEIERRHYHGGPGCVCMHCCAAREQALLWIDKKEATGWRPTR